MNSLLKNSSYLALRYGFISIIGFFTVWFFSRFFPQESYGQYQFIMTLLSLLSFFSLPGLNTHAMRAIARGGKNVVWPTVKYSFQTSLLGSLVLFGVSAYIFFTEQPYFPWQFFLFLGILFPFLYAPNTWYTFFEGRENFLRSSVRLVFIAIVLFVITITLLFLQVSLFALVITLLLVQACLHWYFLCSLPSDEKVLPSHPVDTRFSLETSMQKFIGLLPDALPILIFPLFFAFEKVAIYQVGITFFIAFAAFIGSISTVMLPRLFRGELFRITQNIVPLSGIGILATLGYVVVVCFFHERLFGITYAESTRLALWVAPVVFLLPLKFMLVNSFTAKGFNNTVSISLLIACSLALLPLLIWKESSFIFQSVAIFYTLQVSFVFLLLLNIWSKSTQKRSFNFF